MKDTISLYLKNKVFKALGIVFLLFLPLISSLGQTVVVSDVALKSCLVNTYPTLLDANQELIIENAQSFADTFYCENKGVKDVSVLENFINVGGFRLEKNSIVDVTALSTCTKLAVIDLTSNMLEFVPDLSNHTALKKFYANFNQLDNAPIFPRNIQQIHLGNNSLSGVYDVANYLDLQLLSVFENDYTEIKSLEKLTKLKKIDLHSNKLKTAVDLSNLTLLEDVYLSDNLYQDLPVLPLNNLKIVGIGKNMLTFEDFMPFVDLAIFPSRFTDFANQKAQETSEKIIVNEQDSWNWTLEFDQSLSTNVYSWYRNDVLVNTSLQGALNVANFVGVDTARYYCSVSNTHPKLAGVVIKTNIKTLIVDTSSICFKLTDVKIDVQTKPCEKQAQVNIKATTSGILNGTLEYLLINNLDTLKSTTANFTVLKPASYSMQVKSQNCIQAWSQTLKVSFDTLNCKKNVPYSFSPNGDGVEDVFRFDQMGEALVFDKRGNLVAALVLPILWDGTNKNNELLDLGLYVVIINGTEKLNVTILR